MDVSPFSTNTGDKILNQNRERSKSPIPIRQNIEKLSEFREKK